MNNLNNVIAAIKTEADNLAVIYHDESGLQKWESDMRMLLVDGKLAAREACALPMVVAPVATQATAGAVVAPVKITKEQLLDDLIAYMAIKLFHNRHQNIDEAFVEATLSTWGAEAFGTTKGEPDDIKEALMEYGRVMGEQKVKDQPPAQAAPETAKEPLEIPVGSDARISEDGTTLIVESHFATAMRDGERVIVDRKTGEQIQPKAKPANTAMADALVAAKAAGSQQQN